MKNYTIQFTGLTDSGKTTLSRELYNYLKKDSVIELIDGNTYRQLYNKNLGFSKKDRDINVSSLGILGNYLNKHNINTIIASIAPYNETRLNNRKLIEKSGNIFYEIYCHCDISILRQRDTKGLYKNPTNQSGVNDPYEKPINPNLTVDTGLHDIYSCLQYIVLKLCLDRVIDYKKGFII